MTTILRNHPRVRESLAVCRARVACSQTLYFLFIVVRDRARVIEYKPGRGLLTANARLRARSRALSSLADVFEKNEKNHKTTSVYRLEQGKYLYFSDISCPWVLVRPRELNQRPSALRSTNGANAATVINTQPLFGLSGLKILNSVFDGDDRLSRIYDWSCHREFSNFMLFSV